MTETFALAETLWCLGWLTRARAHEAVLDAIAEGHDLPSLYEFLAGGHSTAAQVHDAFAHILAELDRAPLTPGEAAIRFARSAAQEIAAGTLTPLVAQRANWRELRDRDDLPEVARPFVTLAARHSFYSTEPDLFPDYLAELTETAQTLLDATQNNG
jgi:hypothetical protein